MEITFHNEFSKKYAEILPAITISWYRPFTIVIGWLWFGMTMTSKRAAKQPQTPNNN